VQWLSLSEHPQERGTQPASSAGALARRDETRPLLATDVPLPTVLCGSYGVMSKSVDSRGFPLVSLAGVWECEQSRLPLAVQNPPQGCAGWKLFGNERPVVQLLRQEAGYGERQERFVYTEREKGSTKRASLLELGEKR